MRIGLERRMNSAARGRFCSTPMTHSAFRRAERYAALAGYIHTRACCRFMRARVEVWQSRYTRRESPAAACHDQPSQGRVTRCRVGASA